MKREAGREGGREGRRLSICQFPSTYHGAPGGGNCPIGEVNNEYLRAGGWGFRLGVSFGGLFGTLWFGISYGG